MSDQLNYGYIQTVEIATGDPATVNDATAKAPLGVLMRHNGNVYRYVKFNNGQGNVASAAGGVAHWMTLTMPTSTVAGVFTVTSDQTDAVGGTNSVAGIFGGVVTDGNYCWIQVAGKCTAKTAASVVAGDYLIGGGTDLTFTRIASGATVTAPIYAIGLDTRNTTSGTNTVLLQGLDW